MLYNDDILLTRNDAGVLLIVKIWRAEQLDMKYLGEANYILGIKLLKYPSKRMIDLSWKEKHRHIQILIMTYKVTAMNAD